MFKRVKQIQSRPNSTSGAHYAYWCSDYTLTTTEDKYHNRLQTVHPAFHKYFEDVIEDDLQNCAQWQVVISSEESRQLVTNDIPTL